MAVEENDNFSKAFAGLKKTAYFRKLWAVCSKLYVCNVLGREGCSKPSKITVPVNIKRNLERCKVNDSEDKI